MTEVIPVSESFSLHPQLVQDCIELAEFPLCKLLLCNDSAYPWFILVPKVSDINDIYQLDWQQQQQLLNESSLLSELLIQVFDGDKMNVAALGNVVEQLHIHHVVRYKKDVSWPKPIWGQQPLTPYSDEAIVALKEKLLPKLSIILDAL
ncbi:HIT domain-containing protein [Colwellia sp. 1_MG-2023]|uniref:HIT domain-containing protein n=1 Tax=unclassified Colwellia TaxID=196834 RepID=UPI001C08F832|nr:MULTISPECIES: HIT domain-containing protein [unclassified Colwellia]MBU2923987.1 HIT domain-containing protein [Colwellia sp. C2M11]MDO6653644.1 HIT domain-containing protein [Colwellia sp. 3_MG-2023]MDO6666577.1 HIT domain-containing protein [Colwellia sp. 2_MG-2023]MDO6691020.1 HIT domain-containing protein [Colwellia sp. 1_MG-2023]